MFIGNYQSKKHKRGKDFWIQKVIIQNHPTSLRLHHNGAFCQSWMAYEQPNILKMTL